MSRLLPLVFREEDAAVIVCQDFPPGRWRALEGEGDTSRLLLSAFVGCGSECLVQRKVVLGCGILIIPYQPFPDLVGFDLLPRWECMREGTPRAAVPDVISRIEKIRLDVCRAVFQP